MLHKQICLNLCDVTNYIIRTVTGLRDYGSYRMGHADSFSNRLIVFGEIAGSMPARASTRRGWDRRIRGYWIRALRLVRRPFVLTWSGIRTSRFDLVRCMKLWLLLLDFYIEKKKAKAFCLKINIACYDSSMSSSKCDKYNILQLKKKFR